jgi:nucleotide-binding universal stress UspA family protein
MATFRTILIPIDFSEHASAALGQAVDLARAFEATLHLLHVYQRPVELLSPYEAPLPPSFSEEVREGARRRLDEQLAEVRGAGLPSEAHLVEGIPSEAIVAKARELSADLIVIGTRGLTGLKHVLLGSVAERVIRTAPCPVLAVKTE